MKSKLSVYFLSVVLMSCSLNAMISLPSSLVLLSERLKILDTGLKRLARSQRQPEREPDLPPPANQFMKNLVKVVNGRDAIVDTLNIRTEKDFFSGKTFEQIINENAHEGHLTFIVRVQFRDRSNNLKASYYDAYALLHTLYGNNYMNPQYHRNPDGILLDQTGQFARDPKTKNKIGNEPIEFYMIGTVTDPLFIYFTDDTGLYDPTSAIKGVFEENTPVALVSEPSPEPEPEGEFESEPEQEQTPETEQPESEAETAEDIKLLIKTIQGKKEEIARINIADLIDIISQESIKEIIESNQDEGKSTIIARVHIPARSVTMIQNNYPQAAPDQSVTNYYIAYNLLRSWYPFMFTADIQNYLKPDFNYRQGGILQAYRGIFGWGNAQDLLTNVPIGKNQIEFYSIKKMDDPAFTYVGNDVDLLDPQKYKQVVRQFFIDNRPAE